MEPLQSLVHGAASLAIGSLGYKRQEMGGLFSVEGICDLGFTFTVDDELVIVITSPLNIAARGT
jgi:hypothetical protein